MPPFHSTNSQLCARARVADIFRVNFWFDGPTGFTSGKAEENRFDNLNSTVTVGLGRFSERAIGTDDGVAPGEVWAR
jgi:hypothetical protein